MRAFLRRRLTLIIALSVLLATLVGILRVSQNNGNVPLDDGEPSASPNVVDVMTLVPIVMDSSRDLPIREQALITLIKTEAVDDKSALSMTTTLLHAGLVRSEPGRRRWNRDHPLLDVLVERMPSALEPLLKRDIDDKAPDDRIDADTRRDTLEFWSVLFIRALNRSTDDQLALLNNDEFLANYLWAMDDLLDRPIEGRVVTWFARTPKGLRILAALRSVGEVGIKHHASGRLYLLAVVSTPHTDRSALRLAGTVIRLQEERRWISKALATRCLEIVLRADEDMQTMPYYYHRSLAAGSYVDWYAQAKRDKAGAPSAGDGGDGWNELQPALTAGLEGYLARIANERIQASDYDSRRNSIALPIARILLDGIERGDEPSKATRQLLSRMASFSDERLNALLLDRIEFRARVASALAQ